MDIADLFDSASGVTTGTSSIFNQPNRTTMLADDLSFPSFSLFIPFHDDEDDDQMSACTLGDEIQEYEFPLHFPENFGQENSPVAAPLDIHIHKGNADENSYSPLNMYSFGSVPLSIKPPTMHPNLVKTLKMILSPTRSEAPPNSGFTTHHCYANEGHGKLMVSSRTDESNVRATSMIDVEDEEATVVSLDLIQNRRPFTCSYEGCNKTFKNPQTMKMHYKTHYPGTEVCKVIRKNNKRIPAGHNQDQASSSSNNSSHNKKTPSRCPVCRKTFVGLYELRRHFGRKHNDGEKTHACRKCGKRFYIEVDVRDHEKLCGEPIVCKCGLKFAFRCNLLSHKKANPECQDNHSPAVASLNRGQQKKYAIPAPASSSSPQNFGAAPIPLAPLDPNVHQHQYRHFPAPNSSVCKSISKSSSDHAFTWPNRSVAPSQLHHIYDSRYSEPFYNISQIH